MFILKSIKNLGLAILNGIGGVIFAIAAAFVVTVVTIKIISLGTKQWNQERQHNPHRSLAVMAIVAMFASFFLSLWNYSCFLRVSGMPASISLVCVVINLVTMIWAAVMASKELKQSRTIRLG